MKNRIYNLIARLGNPGTNLIVVLGNSVILLIEMLENIFYCCKNFNLVIKAMYFCGVRSIIIIVVSGWFVGMVLGLQGYNTLQRFGSASMIGSLVALSLFRELGPVLSAILFAARAGSGITASIGLMKVTEQLNAMNIMAVSPIARILTPKFIAGILCVPLLCELFNAAGIGGGYFVGVILLKLDSGVFWSQMQNTVSLHYDIINGLIKSVIFGIVISLIAIYQGYHSKATADGVADATTVTVVSSAVWVLALDFILTAFMF